jgi:hypothetical protein
MVFRHWDGSTRARRLSGSPEFVPRPSSPHRSTKPAYPSQSVKRECPGESMGILKTKLARRGSEDDARAELIRGAMRRSVPCAVLPVPRGFGYGLRHVRWALRYALLAALPAWGHLPGRGRPDSRASRCSGAPTGAHPLHRQTIRRPGPRAPRRRSPPATSIPRRRAFGLGSGRDRSPTANAPPSSLPGALRLLIRERPAAPRASHS